MPQSFKTNNKWVADNLLELKKKYCDLWIAVLNQTVIDKDADLRKLVNRLKADHCDVYVEIAFEYICNEEPTGETKATDQAF